jgi:thymidylate synthase ThyX
MYDCKILADSTYQDPRTDHLNPKFYRFTTFEITAPRFLLAEVNTHRMLSRNSASSRAIPVERSIEAVLSDPFVPETFSKNIKGMQAGEALSEHANSAACAYWNDAIDGAVSAAKDLAEIGVHKGWANRVLEPFKWQTMVISGTDWSNFFALRNSPEAQPEFEIIAKKMQRQYERCNPTVLQIDRPEQWHRPYVTPTEIKSSSANLSILDWNYISVGRCARVSTLTQDGKRDLHADIVLARDRLQANGHTSPFEHVARPFSGDEWGLIVDLQQNIYYCREGGTVYDDRMPDPEHCDYLMRLVEYRGNLRGWHSARADIKNEHDYSLIKGK